MEKRIYWWKIPFIINKTTERSNQAECGQKLIETLPFLQDNAQVHTAVDEAAISDFEFLLRSLTH